MAELVDARRSGRRGCKALEVRLLSSAPLKNSKIKSQNAKIA